MLEILKIEIKIVYSSDPKRKIGEQTKGDALDWTLREIRRRITLEVPENARCSSIVGHIVGREELGKEDVG